MGRVKRSCPPGKHQATSVKGKKFCRTTVYGQNSKTGNVGHRKVRIDKGQKRTTTSEVVGQYKGKSVHRTSRGGLYTVNSSGRKSYLGKNHRFRGEIVY